MLPILRRNKLNPFVKGLYFSHSMFTSMCFINLILIPSTLFYLREVFLRVCNTNAILHSVFEGRRHVCGRDLSFWILISHCMYVLRLTVLLYHFVRKGYFLRRCHVKLFEGKCLTDFISHNLQRKTNLYKKIWTAFYLWGKYHNSRRGHYFMQIITKIYLGTRSVYLSLACI